MRVRKSTKNVENPLETSISRGLFVVSMSFGTESPEQHESRECSAYAKMYVVIT